MNRLKQTFSRYLLLFIMISGVAAGSVFSFGTPSWLLPIMLLPLIHLIVGKATKFNELAIGVLAFFIPFHAVVLNWFLDTNISGIIEIRSSTALITSLLSLIIMTVVLSVLMLPLAWLIVKLRTSTDQSLWLHTITLPAFWVCCEWLRSVGFSVFLYGPGGSIGDYWNFGALGLAATNGPLASLSRLVGMYGLSFLTVLFSFLIYKLITRKMYFNLAMCILLVGITNFIATKFYTETGTKKHASVFQEKTNILERDLVVPIQHRSTTKKDIIVSPEYSRAHRKGFEEFSHAFFNKRLTENGVSVSVSDGGKTPWYGTIEFRDNSGRIIEKNTKELLIPTGEYLPYILISFFNLSNQSHITKDFGRLRQVQKGTPPRVFQGDDLTIAPVACSGILGRDIFRKLTLDGANVLTNSASLLDFDNSQSYFRQSLQMARFHAIANNRTYIQASTGAPSFVLDQNGDYVVLAKSDQTKFIDFEFSAHNQKTLYTKIGEWPLHLSAVFLFLFLASSILKTNKKSRR